jgi:hypothetical protein
MTVFDIEDGQVVERVVGGKKSNGDDAITK